MAKRFYLILVFICSMLCSTWAQTALIRGKVLNDKNEPLPYSTVAIANSTLGTSANENGAFSLQVVADKPVTIIIKSLGYKTDTLNFTLYPNEVRRVQLVLQTEALAIKTVDIKANKNDAKREEVSMIMLDPKTAKLLPSPFGDFNKILATLPGVVSNNELSSQYSVRGGNFDENLVYVNDIEIYRPQLVRAGQQEGLSFVNPDLVRGVEFSSGGWQPRYGDKLSSVLNITYKEPTQHTGSVSLGLLSQAGHWEAVSKNKRFSIVMGARQKTAQYLFQNSALFRGLEVQGEYLPRFVDAQSYMSYNLTGKRDSARGGKTTIGLLLSYARNRYFVKPTARESSFGTTQRIIKLFVAFDGRELMQYDTYQGGIKLSRKFNKRLQSDLVMSGVRTAEREQIDVEGGYRLCDIDPNKPSGSFNDCQFERGVGTFFNYARNDLQANIINILSRNYYNPDSIHAFQWGLGYTQEQVNDKVYEYNFTDSSDYINVNNFLEANHKLNSKRYSGYVQHTMYINPQNTLTYGGRFSYWDVNKQWLISPRIQYAYVPTHWKRNALFKAAAGLYQQAPFYRELRNRIGDLNLALKAQSSLHLIVGSDLNFKMWNRDFKFTSEFYYKYLWNVVPYDVDNIRIRYFATNNAVAYATGADFRVGGEFIKGAESWFSLGIMRTKENISGDSANVVENGSLIGKRPIGYIRRPTDQLVTLSAFFQDHLPNNPTARVYLNLIIGTGLAFGPPNDPTNRSRISGPVYRRVDIGFSKVLTMGDKDTRLGKYFESIWLGADILNVIGAQNTISYTFIKDVNNTQFAIPNTLSQRFINIKVIGYLNSW